MKIGIYGSAENVGEKIKKKAKVIGKEIVLKGHVLITGAGTGISYEAVLGAAEAGGKCIGFSPTTDLENHKKLNLPTKGFSEFVFIPKDYKHTKNIEVCRKYRNVSSVAEVDAAVFVGGRIGTMNEFTIAYDLGKDIGILEDSGGITKEAIKILLRDSKKKSKSEIIYDSDPVRLVERLLKM